MKQASDIQRPTPEELEDMTYEIIRLLKDWGMWDGIRMYVIRKSPI